MTCFGQFGGFLNVIAQSNFTQRGEPLAKRLVSCMSIFKRNRAIFYATVA
jgi:hypothetical protein